MRVEIFLFQHLLWAHTPLKVQNSLSLLSIFAQGQTQKVRETRWIKTNQRNIWQCNLGPLSLPGLMSPSNHAFTRGGWRLTSSLLQILKSILAYFSTRFSLSFNLRKEKENNIFTGSKNLKTWDYSTGSCFSDCRTTCHCESTTGSEQKIH